MGRFASATSSTTALLKYTIFFAGSIHSGKSSVSRAVAEVLGAKYASFGDEVRERATKKGLDSNDRTVLQDIGEDLVKNRLPDLISAVLQRMTPRDDDSQFIIMDGLRHVAIFEAINARLPERKPYIIYVATSEDVRHARGANEGLGLEASERADAHSNESQSSRLRSLANLCVPGDDDVKTNALRIAAFLRSPTRD